MTQEVLKLALEALELCNGAETVEGVVIYTNKEITAIKEALAQPEQDNTYGYASSLATAIWQKHYMKESPKFALLDTTEGVLTQIDNMTCGLVREKPAQPEQEPVKMVAYNCTCGRTMKFESVHGVVAPQRTWVDLTDNEVAHLKMLGRDLEFVSMTALRRFARDIAQTLKEKNNG